MPALKCCVLFLLLQVASAFWDQGHMAVSQLAFNELEPGARARYQELLMLSPLPRLYPKSSTPLWVGAWMDDIKRDTYSYSAWHYLDKPVYADDFSGARVEPPLPEENIVWGINSTMSDLRDAGKTEFEKAIALRILIHLMGDLHQPLHNAGRFSAAFPTGDRGGNDIFVQYGTSPTKLHAFWDSGAGLFEDSPYCCYPRMNRSPAVEEYLQNKIIQLDAATCTASVSESLDVYAWHVEGWELAKTTVYPGIQNNSVLTSEYMQSAQPVSYTHLRAHETVLDLVCRLLLEKKKKNHTELER
eukprot:TRINITY_DN16842_c0_g1_i2.p1 TRINITY_DN16842_c0_g1~~TRINITY_DN16842_c0_g1_i2.p1  ORF type:complete len:301 (+),score=43.23 TRINITY_DN16842_c0_g1_i2:198-1100(+)